MADEQVETRAVRVAKKRKALLDELIAILDKSFTDRQKNSTKPEETASDNFLSAVREVVNHIEGLKKKKPQETTFYQSVLMEFTNKIESELRERFGVANESKQVDA